MARQRRPESELTQEQLTKRLYNERYREKVREKSKATLSLVSNEKKKTRIREKSSLISNEKKASYILSSNGSGEDFSNVLSFPVRETQDFSIAVVEDLRNEIEKLRAEVAQLRASQIPQRTPRVKNFLSTVLSFLAVIPLPLLLIWQMKDMLELTGNKGGLILSAGLEYAVLIAAGAAGSARNWWNKTIGTAFVFGLTAIMAMFVISGVEKRSVSGSDSYKRISEERSMVMSDRDRLEGILAGLPLEYKTKRAEVQIKIEEKTKVVGVLGAKLEELQKSGGSENWLALWSNIGSRILLMLMEAWLVHRLFSKAQRT